MNHVDNPFESPSILSLCPGVRGLERGIERAIGRINVIAYVEIEAFIIANLVAEMEKGFLAPAPIWSDIKTFNAKPFRNKVRGIIGGYPCQPFSNAGARNGTSDPRHLYPFISGIIEATRPVWCFFENVEGHLTLGYPEVSADLRNMGYAVEAGIYSAEEVGAPHQRDRLFILAIKQEFLEYARSAKPHRISKFKWKENTSAGVASELEYTHNHGYDGTQDRKGNNEGENRNQTGQRATIKLEGSSNTGESSNVENANSYAARSKFGAFIRGNGFKVLRQGNRPECSIWIAATSGETFLGNSTSERQQESRSRLLSELPAKEGTRLHDRPEQPGIGETPPGRHLLADTEGPTPKGRDWKGASQRGIHQPGDALENMMMYLQDGQQDQESNNTTGKSREQLNPAWVAQLMGTTLEKTFFVHMVIQ